jgi:hypothetical protein
MRRWSLALTGVVVAGAWAATAAPALAVGGASMGTLRPSGNVTLRALPATPLKKARALDQTAASMRVRLFDVRESAAEEQPASESGFPAPAPLPVKLALNRLGWEGITNLESALAPGNGGFSGEPPDQGLCVGTFKGQTTVFESVNSALTAYDTHGNQLLPGPVSLNAFFGLPPLVNDQGKFGPFVSDPKCYWDPETHHWFHTILVISLNPDTGAFKPPAFTALAVSATADPLGTYHIYRIPATDLGQPHCPCFGDQPLLGADRFGIYVNTSEYSIFSKTSKSNFAQLYALPKRALQAGQPLRFVHLRQLTNTGLNGRTTATIQPAFTGAPGQNVLAHNGTEYFLSGFDCVPQTCNLTEGPFNKITVWAMTNTRSLQTAHPAVHLSRANLTVGRYANPPWQFQRTGPTPFGCDPKLGADCHTPPVEANDVRMNQVMLSNGLLWSGINTGVSPGPRVGVEYFIVRPSVSGGAVAGDIARQGYVSATHENVSFPSIGVNGAGNGVLAFSLMGRVRYPSAAYVRVNSAGASGPIRIAQTGFRPEDGFTCYAKPFGFGPPCRWGDYSASVAGPDGRIWSATEYIGPHARAVAANWATFIFPITP